MTGTDPKLQNPVESSRPLVPDEYQASIAALVYDAQNYMEQEVGPVREKGWRYWHGACDVEPAPDRTKMVSTDVFDVTESTLTLLMEEFTGNDELVEFKARPGQAIDPRAIRFAREATQACNYVFWSQDGWVNLEDWSRNALNAKQGIWKVWSENVESFRSEIYENVDYLSYLSMGADGDIEFLGIEGDPEVEPVSIQARLRSRERKYWIEVIPPEEFIINREANNTEDARIIGQRTIVRVSDVVEMGVPFEVAVQLRSTEVEDTRVKEEREARRNYITQDQEQVTIDRASWPVKVYDLYVLVDRDGDGYAERRHCIAAGDNINYIIYDEEVSRQPYVMASPVPTPNSAIGRSQAETIFDFQDQQTYTIRQTLDNLAHVNNARSYINEKAVNELDHKDNKFGGTVRCLGDPGRAVYYHQVPYVGHQTLPILKYNEERREMRTGVGRTSMGFDAEALQSSTDVGVRGVLGRTRLPSKMTARTLAERGLKPMFKKLLQEIVENQEGPLLIPIGQDRWMEFNPAGWMPEMDVVTKVGLGTFSREEKIQALMATAEKQEQILQHGLDNPLVTLEQYANTLQDLATLSPMGNAGRYFNPPEKVAELWAQRSAQPQPDPAMLEAQAKQQTEIQKAQIGAEADIVEALINARTEILETQIETAMKAKDAEVQAALKAMELQLEATLERYGIDMKADTDVRLRSPVQ